jgi:tRNA A37 methylthiotransferase MiaB
VPLLELIAERPNICKAVHMPAQSGNSAVLERMRRGYTREAYLALVSQVSWHPTSPHSPHHQAQPGATARA